MKKNIFWFFVLIFAAIAIICNALGFKIEILFIPVLFMILFLTHIVKSLFKKEFGDIFLPLALFLWLLNKYYIPQDTQAFAVLDKLTPWPLIIVAILLSSAFGMIKGNKKGKSVVVYEDGVKVEKKKADTITGQYVKLENKFGALCHNITSNDLITASIENAFGSYEVSFTDAELATDNANIEIECLLGNVTVTLPSKWNVSIEQVCTVGQVQINGMCSQDAEAKHINLSAQCVFANITVNYI